MNLAAGSLGSLVDSMVNFETPHVTSDIPPSRTSVKEKLYSSSLEPWVGRIAGSKGFKIDKGFEAVESEVKSTNKNL